MLSFLVLSFMVSFYVVIFVHCYFFLISIILSMLKTFHALIKLARESIIVLKFAFTSAYHTLFTERKIYRYHFYKKYYC
jgi:hypothetical protein